MKVGYLGPKGTFSYEASIEYVENKENLVEFKTIPDTIFSLEKGIVDKAIVPIENSLQGCVTDAIDTLIEKENIKVIGEICLEIKQNLLAKTKLDLDKIEIDPPTRRRLSINAGMNFGMKDVENLFSIPTNFP